MARSTQSRFLFSTLKGSLKAIAYSLSGAAAVLLVLGVLYLDGRTDLAPWHLVHLDEEFTADTPIADFDAYLALEDRLFAELDARVIDDAETTADYPSYRYRRGGPADPGRWPVNWNRSFEHRTDNPTAAVLLLHGMSDSPYSLRSLGERLHQAGAWVVGLRLPGHGTLPSGLVEATWEDMAAAVRIGIRHLAEKTDGRPLYIVGYSNGAALAVEYALATLEDPSLPQPAGLALISPAIGVSPVAALAVWQARLGHLLGLDKLAWNAILPEYDPFKYGSFAVNAGDQVHRLTSEIQRRLDTLDASGDLRRLPPIMAMQSAVDATVSTPALVRNLFARLPADHHELVLFDINRESHIEPLLNGDPTATIAGLLADPERPFRLSVLTNRDPQSLQVVEHRIVPGDTAPRTRELGLSWPEGVYSLSHVALPFDRNDRLYGTDTSASSPGIRLGDLDLRGERGVLTIPAAEMLRQRWNPFYPYLEARLLDFVKLAAATSENGEQ
jgi:alpha-beta hydrolase superfamily lysophospholipase